MQRVKSIKQIILIFLIIAIIVYLVFMIWFRTNSNQVNELNIKINNESNFSVVLDLQIFDSNNNSVYKNNVTIEPNESFRTGDIMKKADRYHFILITDTGLVFDDYTNVDGGFYSPNFTITNSEIEIHQKVK